MTRIALVFLMLTGLVVGLWAYLGPQSWYDTFPGFGHAWVSADGPFNGHLVRDVGAAYLSFAVLSGLALFGMGRVSPLAVGSATLIFNALHLYYHLTMLGMFAPVDAVLNVAVLGLSVLCSVWLVLPRAQIQWRG